MYAARQRRSAGIGAFFSVPQRRVFPRRFRRVRFEFVASPPASRRRASKGKSAVFRPEQKRRRRALPRWLQAKTARGTAPTARTHAAACRMLCATAHAKRGRQSFTYQPGEGNDRQGAA